MTSSELRDKFLQFFKEKGHAIIPSAPLVPENDPSVLFNTAGMQPLVPYLLGEKHPSGKRLADCQKCVRTNDIDEVGDAVHLTFFEMLGNWSLGDPASPDGIGQGGYFKDESIAWSFELLTDKKWFNIPKEKLAVTVFKGDADAAFDDFSYKKWLSLGIPEERIVKLGKEDNWWPAGGKNPGPQGPDTEIFFWTGADIAPKKFNPADKKWVEIWNNVFMEFNKSEKGYAPLKQKNVDTGMGLERTLMVLNGKDNVFETDLFKSIIELIKKSGENVSDESARIVADHLRTATFLIADGVLPGNKDQGYVLRRLLRRAIFRISMFAPGQDIGSRVIKWYVDEYSGIYPNLREGNILGVFKEEEGRFLKTIEEGKKELEKGTDPFILWTTYGFPVELTKELGVVDEDDFKKKMKEHQDLSRTSSSGMFKGGLGDAENPEVVKYHTATHLLHRALHDVLKTEITQKGSNITAERLRFDFTFGRKMTDEEKKKTEEIVNEKIQAALPVNKIVMKKSEAEKTGASHAFGDKYGDEVSIYFIGETLSKAYSKEFCGGPHVKNTSELGHFKIQKEEAVSAGVRRIKAVLV